MGVEGEEMRREGSERGIGGKELKIWVRRGVVGGGVRDGR